MPAFQKILKSVTGVPPSKTGVTHSIVIDMSEEAVASRFVGGLATWAAIIWIASETSL